MNIVDKNNTKMKTKTLVKEYYLNQMKQIYEMSNLSSVKYKLLQVKRKEFLSDSFARHQLKLFGIIEVLNEFKKYICLVENEFDENNIKYLFELKNQR